MVVTQEQVDRIINTARELDPGINLLRYEIVTGAVTFHNVASPLPIRYIERLSRDVMYLREVLGTEEVSHD